MMEKAIRTVRGKGGRAGFTLVEVVVGMALIGIAVLGLAQMFTLGVMNNMRSDRITTASFLAQQQVDFLRNLTGGEISLIPGGNDAGVDVDGDGAPDVIKDQLIDINNDNRDDYRRITEVQASGTLWLVDVLVFTQEQFGFSKSDLLQFPGRHQVRVRVSTVISR
jgi:prepilin-type N-terminal cleavage/methylation domain-containing protein